MTEATLMVNSPEELLQLFGPRDQHLRKLRQLFDVTITHRNGRVRIAGEGENVNGAMRSLELLLNQCRKRGGINDEDIETVAAQQGATIERAGTAKIAATEDIAIQHAGRRIRPRTEGQAHYVETIRDHDLTFATGPAGCGKTYLAVATAVEALKAGQIRKIVLVRPAVEAGENLGFLPGDLRAKLNPYLRPLLDALGEMVDYDRARELMEQEIIEVIPLAYMRGRTLNDAFIILDEAQNTTVAQMKMFLTRMGERSKMVVSGDATQQDLPHGVTSGLRDALRRLSPIKAIGVVRLGPQDIVRHRLVQRIVEAYEADDVGRNNAESGRGSRNRRGPVRVIGGDVAAGSSGEGRLDR
ncbi:phosphate starvation-inducible protein PhoH [Roseiconus nitratireducens]|uniref:PhoH-like protein n=1 Tax=Roseiconus nitratireducens TaxID=2605748 RepID=A0A5M6D503_9BACT|nr:PhoH family protein [Roseiconus nitratireducens]KAA5541392.1 phosphate starvation-inducible protein PhoH [Roseiconus nitratireducens]